jgi:hypothetical protein
VYKLIDEFSLFHAKFMANGKLHGRGSWTSFSSKQIGVIWCGIAFEHLCLKHIQQIKNALGIYGVHSEHFVWRHKPKAGERGAQIDLLIDRSDQCINVCELKFSTTPFEITKKYAPELQNKLDVFKLQTQTRKTLFLTLITTYGLHNRKNYPGLIQSEVTMDALFQTLN